MKKNNLKLLLAPFLIIFIATGFKQEIVLEKRQILENKVEILLPKEFEIMSEEMVKLEYSSSRRPTLIFSDKNGTVNVAFNLTTNNVTQDQIEIYKNSFVSTFKNSYPTAKWLNNEVKVINGRKVGCVELITPAIDQPVYNLIFFTNLNGKLLLATFNCIEKKQPEWSESAQKIMHSLKVN